MRLNLYSTPSKTIPSSASAGGADTEVARMKKIKTLAEKALLRL